MAAHAGLNKGEFDVDDDSIDLAFKSRGFRDRLVRSPQIEFQLKCSSRDLVQGEVIRYPLPVKNYNDLRGENLVIPRYLAILLVPNDTAAWIRHNDDHVALYNHCYWVSLRDADATDNVNTVTVEVPLANHLTSETLRQMIERASHGEWL